MSRNQLSVIAVAWLVTTTIAVVALVRTFTAQNDLVVRSLTVEDQTGGPLTTKIPGRIVIDPSGISMDTAGRIVIGDNLKMASNATSALVHLGGTKGSLNLAPTHLKRLDTGWSMLFESSPQSAAAPAP